MSGYCEECGETVCVCKPLVIPDAIRNQHNLNRELREQLAAALVRNTELERKLAMLRDATEKLTSICVTQVAGDYNDVIHAAFISGKEALSSTEQDVQTWKQQVRDDAYAKGRNDMHDAVMAEWDKPAQVGDAHIGDRLRKLKGT